MSAAKNRLVRCFLNVDMRNQHKGLTAYARKSQVDLRSLSAGELVVFINRKLDRVKLYATGDVLAYQILQKGRTLDLRAIGHIPAAFGASGKLDLDAAVKKVIEQEMGRRGQLPKTRRTVSPLQAAQALK
jgi:hypothetical protein